MKPDFSRKLICLSLIGAVLLGGCGSQIAEMTEEQQAQVGEYAAFAMLRYDAEHRSRLVDYSEVEAADELFARLEINVEIKGEGKVKSDRELLEQATRNLIGNVAKYARARTRVDIEIGKEGFTITNLTDQKIKDASKLKEPFVKGEESRGSENGSGLGLSIADNCLAAAGHKLDIKVEGDKFIAGVRW